MVVDRGDISALPDPDWSSRTATWGHKQVDDYIASHALAGPLRRDQIKALLQHLPPPPAGWDAFPGVLEEYAPTIARWDADVERGAVPANPMPHEFAAWCDHMRIDLPRAFVDGLCDSGAAPTRAPQSATKIAYPPWVPITHALAAQEPPKPRRGRPKGSGALTENLVREARKLLDANANKGIFTTIPELAKDLKAMPEFARLDKATIQRKLNGKLAWAKNRDKAAGHLLFNAG